jgi:hypothetical protein
MIIRSLFIFILSLTFATTSKACDACGCAMSGNYSGIYPLFTKNIFGVRFGNRSFDHPLTDFNFNGTSRVLRDEFNSMEVWGRFYPHPRVQVFAFVPFREHTREETERTTKISGIGDITLSANYTLFNTADSASAKIRHALLIGGGLFLPTGKYMQRDERLVTLPAQFQVGTGAFGYSVNANYTYRLGKFGINADLFAKFNEENERSYEFGNQTAVTAALFYKVETGTTAFLPNLGASFEHYEKDSEFGNRKDDTGGEVMLLNAGVDVYMNRFFISASAQIPIQQTLPFSQPASADRFNLGLAYTF